MKQKNQIIVLVVLLVVAALVWTFERDRQTPTGQTISLIERLPLLAEEDPQVHWGPMGLAQKTEYKSNGRNPFSMIAPPTPKELQERQNKIDQAKNQPPPVPPDPPKQTIAIPPANLKFFGYGAVPIGSARRAFFFDGEDVYIVTEGEMLLGRYRILKVGNANLEFQEISSGLRGTMPLDEQAAPPSA